MLACSVILFKKTRNTYPFPTHYNKLHSRGKILILCISFFSESSTLLGQTMEIIIEYVKFAAKSISV